MSKYSRKELYTRLSPACLANKTDSDGGLNVADMKFAVIEFADYFGSLLPNPTELRTMLRSKLIDLIVSSGILDNKQLNNDILKATPVQTKSVKVQSFVPAPADPIDKPLVHKITGVSRSNAVSSASAAALARRTAAAANVPRAPVFKAPVPQKKSLIVGDGEPRGQIPGLTAKLNTLLPRYEHILVETGGGGHCGYYCFAAGLNVINKMRGIEKIVTYKDLRATLADTISTLGSETIESMYLTEYGKMPVTLAKGKEQLITDTLNRRWATEYDLSQLGTIYGIGVILFNMKTGKLYNMAYKYNGFTHYMIIANNPGAHYQNIGLRRSHEKSQPQDQEVPYRYAFECVELPDPIKAIINEEATTYHTIQKFQCKIIDFTPVVIGTFAVLENAENLLLTEDGIEYLNGILNTLHSNISEHPDKIDLYIPGDTGKQILYDAQQNRDIIGNLNYKMSGIIIHVCSEILKLVVNALKMSGKDRQISEGVIRTVMNNNNDLKYINYGISTENEFPQPVAAVPAAAAPAAVKPAPKLAKTAPAAPAAATETPEAAPAAATETPLAATEAPAPYDQYNLQRFITAQDKVYDTVIKELTEGKKKTHWIWYIFPHHSNIKTTAPPSLNSRTYGIRSIEEAKAYIEHPILGVRLLKCVDLVLSSPFTLQEIFKTDDAKFYACISLFSMATFGENNEIQTALKKYWNGDYDEKTLSALVN